MAEIAHIFRKDVRHLWPRVMVVLLLMVAHAVFDVRSKPLFYFERARDFAMANMLGILLTLAMAFLIAWLVFEETIPGDRQFWLTRPYRWTKLLGAKILFAFVFLNVPLFLADCYMLGVQGFAVLDALPSLLLRQLLLTSLFILPSFAMAALTKGVSQFLLGWFFLLLLLVCEGLLQSLLARPNTSISIGSGSTYIAGLFLTTVGIVIWQYATRKTTAARAFAVSAASVWLPVVIGLSWFNPFQAKASASHPIGRPSSVRIAYDWRRTNAPETGPKDLSRGILLRLPLALTALPAGALLRGNAVVTIDVGGKRWPQPGSSLAGPIEKIGGDYWQSFEMDSSWRDVLEHRQANLHSVFTLEVVSDAVESRAPLTARRFFVPKVGLCQIFRNSPSENASTAQLACWAGLGTSIETAVRLDSGNKPGRIVGEFAAHGIPAGLSPISDLGTSPLDNLQEAGELAFIPRRKIAEQYVTLDAFGISLGSHMAPEVQ